ncbi:chemotaxis protein CheW [Clostridium carnis]
MGEIKVLVFKLGHEFYATDIMEVERILGYEEPVTLPDSPDFLEGVINYETGVLPIISLVKKFRQPENKDSDDKKIIVVKKESGKFGILVDNVSEVKSITEEEINNPNAVSTLVSKKYIRGLIKKNESIIIMLDLDMILTLEEEEMIFQG